jgi:hypothetical protein
LLFEWYVERRGKLEEPHHRALADVGESPGVVGFEDRRGVVK